jgi:NAD(P)-dependent dehydrogenase (short-subunit alcohol dehydrogenase family)
MAETVLISGAGRGIGLEMAGAFLERGFIVHALTARVREGLDRLVAGAGGRLRVRLCDVSDEAQVGAAAAEIRRESPELGILVNNAAVHIEEKDWESDPAYLDDALKTYEINSLAPLRLARHFIPSLLRGGRKLLVNISSEAGSIADCGRKAEFGYCMSKSALNMASVLLQNRYRERGLKVLALHPGWVRTDMGGSAAPITPAESARKLLALMERPWKVEEPLYYDLDGKRMSW